MRPGGLAAILFCLFEWGKEKASPTHPRNVRFDWDAYYEDTMTLKHYVKGRQQRKNSAAPIASVYGL